jgi:hypothetical protein
VKVGAELVLELLLRLVVRGGMEVDSVLLGGAVEGGLEVGDNECVFCPSLGVSAKIIALMYARRSVRSVICRRER